MNEPENSLAKGDDVRIAAIKSIGRVTITSFALSIPLVVVGGAFNPAAATLIPLSIAGSSAAAIIAVWTLGRPKAGNSSNTRALEKKVKELEQRLGNLEVIDRTSAKLSSFRERPLPAPVRQYE